MHVNKSFFSKLPCRKHSMMFRAKELSQDLQKTLAQQWHQLLVGFLTTKFSHVHHHDHCVPCKCKEHHSTISQLLIEVPHNWAVRTVVRRVAKKSQVPREKALQRAGCSGYSCDRDQSLSPQKTEKKQKRRSLIQNIWRRLQIAGRMQCV